MRSRGVRGAVIVLVWLTSSVVAAAATGLLYVDDKLLSLTHPAVSQGTTLLVPLEEFASRIGLDVADADGRIVLRGDGFRQAFDEAIFPVMEETSYVSLDWILDLSGGKAHRVGDDVYVETHKPTITAIEAEPDHVVVRLTGFTAHTVASSHQGASDVVSIQWPNCSLGANAQRIRVGETAIQEVRLVSSGGGAELSTWLKAGTVLATQELDTEDAYVLTLQVAPTATQESILEAEDGMKVREWSNAAGSLSVDSVYVESWRDRYRLVPTVPSAGYESEASLVDLLSENGAICAVPLDCPYDSTYPDCLILDGIPYRLPEAPSEVLAIDLFGRWTTFSSVCSVSLKHAGQLVAIDGVNRPLVYGEIVSYAPGYSSTIGRGLPGSFLAIKIRENRVVSVYQGPFVPNDASAILVVASGDATAKLASIRLGDSAQVVCQFPQAEGTYRHVVSTGPMIMKDSSVVLGDDARVEVSHLAGAVILACDWQGGLYLLTIAAHVDGDSGTDSWDPIGILRGLPTSIKDAVLLSSCPSNALAYAGVSSPFQLGAQDPVRLALNLVPTTP